MSAPTTVSPDQPKTAVEMVNVQIDGEWKQFPKGTRVIEACGQVDKYIPRYCYHPKLSSPGNCRMCMVEMGMPKMGADRKPEVGPDGKPVINWIPRPQISCAQDVAEGMAIRTDSPMVQDSRKGVMEFLLINHPLDCSICDQAGECQLQEFSIEYGQGASRFLEEKVHKPKHVDLGPRIMLDDERCILCSRCIRFTKEIAKDDALGFTDRGSYTKLQAHPGHTFDNNYTLNTVDICPVGALTSKDFRFKMRAWFLRETKSICTSCGTGCNTIVHTREDTIYRQTPRENDAVNSTWMCDYGRLNFHYLEGDKRLLVPQIRDKDGNMVATEWKHALAQAAGELRQVTDEGGTVAILASARMTNEELFLVRRLADALGCQLMDVVARMDKDDGILMAADRNPNTHGAKLMRVAHQQPGALTRRLADEVNGGQVQALLCFGEDVAELGVRPEALDDLPSLVVLGIQPSATSAAATVVLPGSGFAEKRGSMINVKGRLQRLNRATNPPGQARDDWEILRDLIQALTGSNGIYTIEDLFKAMATEVLVFTGLSLSKIGDIGVPLDLPTEGQGDAQMPPRASVETVTGDTPSRA